MKVINIKPIHTTEGVLLELACSKCEETVHDGYKFCPKCGRELNGIRETMNSKRIAEAINEYLKKENH